MTVAACDDLWKNKFLSSLSATKAFKNQKVRAPTPAGNENPLV